MTANRNCNLECLQDKVGTDVLEFVGPVKIVLVDTPKQRYYVSVCKASALLIAAILLGITTMSVLFFSTTYKREDIYKALHIFVCTIGMQIFMPFGILIVKRLSGPAAAMKPFQKRLEHIILNLLGYLCITGGTFITFFCGHNPYFTPHSCLGLATGGLVLLNALFGVFFSCFKCSIEIENLSGIRKSFYYVHKVIGAFALIASSACFITGIMKQPYVDWLPIEDMLYFHIVFCILYT
ncbi:uncharacterized protein LOC121735027, partial [Aricia agestis]|uniref:uncharacterized protein LOC121735027 n=1 Tax=Aricia agestis TaxID=91739 RepID=UPI001C2048C5